MMTWDNTILVVCGMMALIAIYLEYRRANKQYLVLRIIALMLAIFGLLGLIYPFSYTEEVSATAPGRSLLTDGFDIDIIDHKDSLFTIDTALHRHYPYAKLLTTVNELFADTSHQAPLSILGWGLDETSLKQLKGHYVNFYPTRVPDGFTSIDWQHQAKAGRPQIIKGRYDNSSSFNLKLTLSGMHTDLDSFKISSGSDTIFTIKTTPKTIGRAVYKLIVTHDSDTVDTQDIPVNIAPAQPIKVLMLSSSPDFEVKFLKEWLASKGYGIASRSIISKGKFGQDFLNMDRSDLSKLSPSLLSKFDAIIGDLSVLSALSPAESNTLQNEVYQKGLGLIIRADSTDKKVGWLQGSFPLIRSGNVPAKPSVLAIAGSGRTAKLNIATDRISLKNDSRALVTDDRGKALAASALNGSGRQIFTTLNDTYIWALSGNKTDYAKVWSGLLDEVLRKSPAMERWSIGTSVPMPGQQVNIVNQGPFLTDGVVIDQDTAYAAQDAAMPFRQTFSYWPKRAGWQQITSLSGKPFWWYVWHKGSWKSIVAAERIAATQKFASENKTAMSGPHQVDVKTRIPISKIWFFILFLMAATFLWAESKFFSS